MRLLLLLPLCFLGVSSLVIENRQNADAIEKRSAEDADAAETWLWAEPPGESSEKRSAEDADAAETWLWAEPGNGTTET
ncbi:hypothetical protein MMC10_007513 [Thelotrema lepadinum]|nr:hypothetical protein [Thelotrema lepadinum]